MLARPRTVKRSFPQWDGAPKGVDLRASWAHAGTSILGVRGSRTPDFAQGVVGGRRGGSQGSREGREILLYHIMYRNYARKWWLLKRYRIISPEVAVNEQFLPGKSIFFKLPEKSKFFENLPGKIEICKKFAWKNRNIFGKIAMKKSKFLGNWPGNFVDPDPRPPRFQTRYTPLGTCP